MSRNLPNLHALRAFEAAARLHGFKRAAEELNVSPTAISHHIRNLETRLCVSLFVRQTRKVVLTEAGEKLLRSSREAFNLINACVEAITLERSHQRVTIALASSFARRWILPRLPRFRQSFPTVDIALAHGSIDQVPDSVDMRIVWGSGRRQGFDAFSLLNVCGTPVASPKLLEDLGPISEPADLLDKPLLAHKDRKEWVKWLHLNGLETTLTNCEVITDDENFIMRAALDGIGIAIGWFPLIQQEITSGALTRLFDNDVRSTGEYNLLVRNDDNRPEIILPILDWLLEEGAMTRAEIEFLRD